MSDSMQEDLDRILGERGSAFSTENPDFDREILPRQEADPLSVSGVKENPGEVHKAISFAQQLQLTREKAMEKEREFKQGLMEMQEQDPTLAKKIKLVGIGIVILLIIFAAVIFQGQKAKETPASNTATVVENNDSAPVESEADKLQAAQDVNDKLRVDTLTNIAQLAVVYHLEQKADLPISSVYVKLNEDNPVTEFLKDALTRYGNSAGVLLDPLNPDYYYAYRSIDGKSIELSARMENENGEHCLLGGSPCLYKKVITAAEMSSMADDLEKYK